MLTLKQEYEEESKKKWWINPVCHGEQGFCSDDYMRWLEVKVAAKETIIAEQEATFKKLQEWRVKTAKFLNIQLGVVVDVEIS